MVLPPYRNYDGGISRILEQTGANGYVAGKEGKYGDAIGQQGDRVAGRVLTLVKGDAGLVAVLWPDDDPRRVRRGECRDEPDHPVLVETERQLDAYFAGKRTRFAVPLDFRGTDFQRQVWSELVAIPYGETRSYGEIARAIGRPSASRAVGAANGRNPISIIAPCHRVVGSNGALTGFAGGLAVKERLLALERDTASVARSLTAVA